MSSLIVEVVRLNEFTKHPNADTLQIATVKGWRCIVKDPLHAPPRGDEETSLSP